jgi:Uma2 family endonuclease
MTLLADPQTTTEPMTVEAFLAWAEETPDHQRYELHDGVVVEMSPSKAKQTVIAARIIAYLTIFAEEHDLGYVSSSDGGLRVSKQDFYAPDAAFYAKARLPGGLPDNDYFTLAPDLAVEVVSSSDKYSAHEKAQRYLALGVKLVWVVYPERDSIEVYTPAEEAGAVLIRTLRRGDTLTGGAVLPGFSTPVARVLG